MSTTRAVSHIFGRPINCYGPTNICNKNCIAIKNAEDDRRVDFRKARDELAAVIREKESALEPKQCVLDTISQRGEPQKDYCGFCCDFRHMQ